MRRILIQRNIPGGHRSGWVYSPLFSMLLLLTEISFAVDKNFFFLILKEECQLNLLSFTLLVIKKEKKEYHNCTAMHCHMSNTK